MDFVRPDYKTVSKKLKTNKKLEKFLTDLGVLITIDDFYEEFSVKSKKNPKKYIKDYNDAVYEKLTDIIYENKTLIENSSIDTLVNSKTLFSEIKLALGFDEDENISNSIYREIYYSYKTSFSENFWQNNWENFIPEVEAEELQNNDAASGFLEALAKEFDRLDEMISDVARWHSYEEIPDAYINHLTQLLGIEQKTFSLKDEQLSDYRILASNILEIYKYKGALATFELMFRFLGYNVTLTQYYFDRRYYFCSDEQNTETNTNKKKTYKFYLTSTKPSYNISDNFAIDEIVTEKDYSKAYNLNDFNDLVEKYGLECVLGYDDFYTVSEDSWENGVHKNILVSYPYEDNVYKYFKTNLVKITPTPFGKYANFTYEQIQVLKAILDFLTPYFWKRELVVIPVMDGDEKLTVNGHRNRHVEDGSYVNDEGFRLLDSETWIQQDETQEISDFEQARLDQIKRNYVLKLDESETDSEQFIRLRDNTIVITQKQYEENYKTYSKLNFTKLYTIDNEVVYAKDIYDKTGFLNDNVIYYNSIGESKGSRPYSEDDKPTNYNVVFEPINKKLVTINTTKYWGKVKDSFNSDSKLPMYPIYTRDYVPVKEDGKTSTQYFYPGVTNEGTLYIPKHNDYDLSNEWENLDLLDLVGWEGNTLKKFFLSTKESKKIKWVIPEDMTLSEFLKAHNDENFFKTEDKTVPNLIWEEVMYGDESLIIYKDKTEIIEVEKEIWKLAKKYEMSIDNIYRIEKEQIDLITNKTDLEEFYNYYNSVAKLKNSTFLSEFVKKYNVVNYDYVNDKLLKSDISTMKYNSENGSYILTGDDSAKILNSIGYQNSFYLQYNSEDSFRVFKLVYDKYNAYNRIYFKPLISSKLTEDLDLTDEKNLVSFDELVYAETDDEFNSSKRLMLIDGKTYLLISRDKVSTYKEYIRPGTIIKIKVANEEGALEDKLFIAEVQTTNYKTPSKVFGYDDEYVDISDSSSTNEEIGSLYFSKVQYKNSIIQKKYANLKKGDLIFSPKEDKIYEILFDGVCNLCDEKYDTFDSYDYQSINKEQGQVIYNLTNSDTELEDNVVRYRFVNDNGEEVESDVWPTEVTLFDKAYTESYGDDLIFGIKPVELVGSLVKEDDGWKIYTHEKYYRGVSEQDDNDNYILNNYNRDASWEVLSGCKTDYLKDKKITRPTRHQTDKIFEEAMVSTSDKNNNKQIVDNILNEILGDQRFLSEVELVKTGV